MLLQLASSCERPRSPRHARSCTGTRGRGGSVKIKSQGWIINRTLRGSFSAVSTPNFASKYSFELRIFGNALDEIYKISTLLHRSAFKNSAKFRQTFSHFHSFIFKVSLISSKKLSRIHELKLLMKILRNFSIFSSLRKIQNLLDSQIS